MGRRMLLLAPLLAAIFLGAVVRLADAPSNSSDLEYAATPAPPAIVLSVGVAHTASASTMQEQLDRCDGPVVVRFRGVRPALLAEHDFCGGLWIRRLVPGEVIRLAGGGIGGTYRVTDRIKVVEKGMSAAAIRGMGDVVAQTCRGNGSTLRLVGLSRVL